MILHDGLWGRPTSVSKGVRSSQPMTVKRQLGEKSFKGRWVLMSGTDPDGYKLLTNYTLTLPTGGRD